MKYESSYIVLSDIYMCENRDAFSFLMYCTSTCMRHQPETAAPDSTNNLTATANHTADFPTLLYQTDQSFAVSQQSLNANSAQSNYFKTIYWAPDGSCLLSSNNDNRLRLFDMTLQSYAVINPNESVYDVQWYPKMNSSQLETCCFKIGRAHV